MNMNMNMNIYELQKQHAASSTVRITSNSSVDDTGERYCDVVHLLPAIRSLE